MLGPTQRRSKSPYTTSTAKVVSGTWAASGVKWRSIIQMCGRSSPVVRWSTPIDVQVSSPNMHENYTVAQNLANQIRSLSGVGEVYIPQDLNYPALRLD